MKTMDYEQELLTIFMEECGEAIQSASKIIRFGMDADNRDNLVKEVGDILCMIELMHEYDMLAWSELDDRALVKREKLKKFSSLLVGEDESTN